MPNYKIANALSPHAAPSGGVQALLSAQTVLLIDATPLDDHVPQLRDGRTVVHAHLQMLSASLLDNVRPQVIAAPLIGPAWDIVDVALRLDALDYRQTLVMITRPVPRTHLVLSEVGALCPRVTLAIVEI